MNLMKKNGSLFVGKSKLVFKNLLGVIEKYEDSVIWINVCFYLCFEIKEY